MWESVLDVMLRELQLSGILRHPEVIEVFEAMGLGLAGRGVYRLAFASNLKHQVLLRSPTAQVVRTAVSEALLRVGIDAADVSPVIPERLGWDRRLGRGISDG